MSENNEISGLTLQTPVISLHEQLAALSAKLAKLTADLSMSECESEGEPDGPGRTQRTDTYTRVMPQTFSYISCQRGV